MAAAVADNASIAVTGDDAGKAVIWDLSTRAEAGDDLARLGRNPVGIEDVVISPDGIQVILIGGGWASVYNGAGEYPGADRRAQRLSLSRDLYAGRRNVVFSAGLASMPPRRPTSNRSGPSPATLSCAAWNCPTTASASCRRPATTRCVFGITTPASTLRLFPLAQGQHLQPGASADGNYVAAIFSDGNAVIWAVEGLAPSARIIHDFDQLDRLESGRAERADLGERGGGGNAVLSDIGRAIPLYRLPAPTIPRSPNG